MKEYHYHYQIGRARHCVSYHDGIKRHNDGSPFFDLKICKNKPTLKKFLKKLEGEGYKSI
jgi:hypothetical protein